MLAQACSGMRSSMVGRKSSRLEVTHSATNAGTSAPYFASGTSVAGIHGLSGLTTNAATRPVHREEGERLVDVEALRFAASERGRK